MSRNHVTSILDPGGYRAACTCGWRGQLQDFEWSAEDDVRDHLALIEKIKVHLHGMPSLKTEAIYYRMMASAQDTPEPDRPLWDVLATELEHRLGLNREEQEGLW